MLAGRHHLVARRIAELHEARLIAAPWPSNAGLHTMVELLPGADANRICDELGRGGILVETTDQHWLGVAPPTISIGYGLADEHQLDQAFDRLGDLLTE